MLRKDNDGKTVPNVEAKKLLVSTNNAQMKATCPFRSAW